MQSSSSSFIHLQCDYSYTIINIIFFKKMIIVPSRWTAWIVMRISWVDETKNVLSYSCILIIQLYIIFLFVIYLFVSDDEDEDEDNDHHRHHYWCHYYYYIEIRQTWIQWAKSITYTFSLFLNCKILTCYSLVVGQTTKALSSMEISFQQKKILGNMLYIIDKYMLEWRSDNIQLEWVWTNY